MRARWWIVLLAALALVATPTLLARRPAAASAVTAAELAARVQRSGGVAWSGLVQSSGALQVPDSDSFATLAELLGEDTQLRVWWRSGTDWRVDRIRSTGETDLYRHGGYTTRWVFESETATFAPVSRIRLPDASDLLPPTLARAMLQGARDAELSRLPARRLSGLDAAGLRLTPDDPATSISHVDLWADPVSGLPLQVELSGTGNDRPVLTTTLTALDLSTPAPATTDFTPSQATRLAFEESVDVAAAANAAARFDLPATLAGIGSRTGEDPGAVGIYGRGPTTLVALPLRGQVARPLRDRLAQSSAAERTANGTFAPVGPISVLVTDGRQGRGAFLLAGTVTPATLQRAATELAAST